MPHGHMISVPSEHKCLTIVMEESTDIHTRFDQSMFMLYCVQLYLYLHAQICYTVENPTCSASIRWALFQRMFSPAIEAKLGDRQTTHSYSRSSLKTTVWLSYYNTFKSGCAIDIVSRASAHSQVSAHVPHFNGLV